MRIAISGTAGSGKSTIAKMLAEKLGYKHYSMGDFQRELAEERGITIEELGELEKKDPELDHLVDERQKRLVKEDNFVIDAWLSACFIKNAFRIYMDADIKVRAERILGRDKKKYKSIKDAITKIKQREDTNRLRWIEYYRFDFSDKKNYDFVIDTTEDNIEKIFKKVYDAIKLKSHPKSSA